MKTNPEVTQFSSSREHIVQMRAEDKEHGEDYPLGKGTPSIDTPSHRLHNHRDVKV